MPEFSLTTDQKTAINTLDKNLVVAAGAGTGKTRVLTERIIEIRKRNSDISFKNILALTFTDKAAAEMKERLDKRLRADERLAKFLPDLENAQISTIHSFAFEFLKKYPIEAGIDPNFSVLDEEQADILREEILDGIIEKRFEDDKETFEIFTVYAEGAVRDGIIKIYDKAMSLGKTVENFFQTRAKKRDEFCEDLEKKIEISIKSLPDLKGRNAKDEKQTLQMFFNNKFWDEKVLEDFKTWRSGYKRRGKGKDEWRGVADELLSLRKEYLTNKWRTKLEKLVIEFEKKYHEKKTKKGLLDFEDLQNKAVELLRGETAISQKIRLDTQARYKFILVDESQDTNDLQMELIGLIASEKNLFYVGDYNQSIYGFRGTRPENFKKIENDFQISESAKCVKLRDNFRSSPAILKVVNSYFEDKLKILELQASGQRNREKDFYQNEKEAVKWNIQFYADGEDNVDGARIKEAQHIARQIKAIVEKEETFDEETKEERKLAFGDIAILFRAMSNVLLYATALKAQNIPFFIASGRGFYDQSEIRDMLNFLTFLEKPFAEVSLAAVLRSPFFHINDETLARLANRAKKGKADNDAGTLYDAFAELENIDSIADEQKKRLRHFVNVVQELLSLKEKILVSDLMEKILEKTGYDLFLLMEQKGIRQDANIKKLITMTREYEADEHLSLADFLKRVKRRTDNKVKEMEAQIYLEKEANAVRLMTVHAAKGLEFPVVFVVDIFRKANSGGKKKIIKESTEGYSMGLPNDDDKPCFWQKINKVLNDRDNEEKNRVLYVAMTRAKERLFLSGGKKKKDNEDEYSSAEIIKYCNDNDFKTEQFTDESKTEFAEENFRERISKVIDEAKDWGNETTAEQILKPYWERIDLPVSAFCLFKKDPESFWRVYLLGAKQNCLPNQNDFEIKEKEMPSVEKTDADEPLSHAEFGTAIHSFLEKKLDDLDTMDLGAETNAVFKRFGETARNAQKMLEDFAKSEMYKKIKNAQKTYKEVQFFLRTDFGTIEGIIDVLFQDKDGAWHIVDYKTASGDDEKARRSAYDLQLEIYAAAAEKILNIKIETTAVYYLENQTVVSVEINRGDENSLEKIHKLQRDVLNFCNSNIQKQIL